MEEKNLKQKGEIEWMWKYLDFYTMVELSEAISVWLNLLQCRNEQISMVISQFMSYCSKEMATLI